MSVATTQTLSGPVMRKSLNGLKRFFVALLAVNDQEGESQSDQITPGCFNVKSSWIRQKAASSCWSNVHFATCENRSREARGTSKVAPPCWRSQNTLPPEYQPSGSMLICRGVNTDQRNMKEGPLTSFNPTHKGTQIG